MALDCSVLKRSMARRFLVSHPRIAAIAFGTCTPDVFSPPPLTLPVVVLFVFENIPAFLSEIFPSIPAFSSDESCAPLLQQATFFLLLLELQDS